MKILVVGANWIGDAVMTIPAVKKLRRLFPDATITLLTRPWARDVFGDKGLFDEIISDGSMYEQIRRMRSRPFDLSIVFPNSFRSAMLTRLGGARRSFGFTSQNRSFLLTDPIQVPEWKKSRHEVFYYLALVDEVERSFFSRLTESVDAEPSIAMTESERSQARATLDKFGVIRGRPLVALAPGSTNSRAKRWLPERFAELNDRLQEQLNATVVLLGSADERDVSTAVSSLSKSKPIDLTGETELGATAAILAEADLLVSNDMGLAHLAPAVGTDTIVIFGPTDPATTRPFSERAVVVSANVECAPCMLRDCPIDHRCMTRVSAAMVFDRATELLK